MGTKYTSVTISGYNSSPPSDLSTDTAATNKVQWQKHLDKIGGPIKTAVEAMNSALVTALNFGSRAITTTDSAAATDHMKTIEIASTVTATFTLSLADAATMAAGYVVHIRNLSAVAITIGRVTAGDTIDGTAGNQTLPAGGSVSYKVNAAATGYYSFFNTIPNSLGNVVFPDGTVSLPGLRPGSSADSGIFSSSDDSVRVACNGVEIAQFNTTNLSLTCGQLAFPATQAASANANTLDDYEEGTFTPGISFGGGTTGITYTTQTGTYTKIGNRVFVDLIITLSNKGSSTGAALITGLPFTVAASTFSAGAIRMTAFAAAVDAVPMAHFVASATTIKLELLGNASATVSDMADTHFSNTSQIYLGGQFRV